MDYRSFARFVPLLGLSAMPAAYAQARLPDGPGKAVVERIELIFRKWMIVKIHVE
jgi:hypothetical protein